MPAVKNPSSTVLFEWETGTKSEKTIHTVKLEIPPASMGIRRKKNTQRVVTTKGWAITHGLEDLDSLTASGLCYRPQDNQTAQAEGFDTRAYLSGIEFLNSAYISSGRLSSNRDMKNTINSSLYSKLLNQQVAPAGYYQQKITNPIAARAQLLTQLKNYSLASGNTIGNNNIININQTQTVSYTQPNVQTLQNTLQPMTYSANIPVSVRDDVITSLAQLTTSNVDATYNNLKNLSLTQVGLVQLVDQFDFYRQLFGLGSSTKSTILGVDPAAYSGATLDPFILLKALTSSNLSNTLSTNPMALQTLFLLQQNTGADDWIVTVTIYWQNMVFQGHFDTFNFTASKDTIGLWQWDFAFTVHNSWIMKDRNIIPMNKAFDPSITEERRGGSGNNSLRIQETFSTVEGVIV